MTTLKQKPFLSHRLLIFSILLFFAEPAFSQYSIVGKVSDKYTGTKLSGAHIRINNSYQQTITDASGTFRLSELKAGRYMITITYIGYKAYIKEAALEGDVSLDVQLEPSAIMEDEVVITASRAGEKTATTFSQVEKAEIEKLNMGQDLPYIIERSPSVVTTSDAGTGIGYTNLRIRGTDMNRINVTVNGIPLNDAESHGVWFVDLPDLASSVDNIQVQRGVGTSSNGGAAFGASINMQTQKMSENPFVESGNTFGSFNTLRNYIKVGTGLIQRKWLAEARLSQVRSDGFIDRAESELKSFNTSLAYYGNNDLVKFNVFSGKEKTYQAWDGIPAEILDTNRTWNGMGAYYDNDGNLRFYDNETDNYQQDHYQLFYSRQLGKHLLNLALHYTKGYGYYEQYKESADFASYGIPDLIIGTDTLSETDLIRRKYLDNDFYGVVTSLDLKPTQKLELIIGSGWNHYIGNHFGEIIWANYSANFDKDYRWYDGDGDKKDLNLYVKALYDLSSNAGLFADLQYRVIDYKISGMDDDLRNITQDHNFTFINPKAGAYYYVSDKQKVYASLAVSNREPNRDNYTDTDPGMPGPKPETLNDVEAGYSYINNKISLSANVYYMNYKDQLVLTGKINDVGNPVMTNVDKSFRSGIEISVQSEPCKWVSWDLNATLSRNRIKGFMDYVVDFETWPYNYIAVDLGGTDIAFSPSLITNSNFAFHLPGKVQLSLNTKYVGKQYLDNTESSDRMLDEYLVNDIGVYYKYKHKSLPEIQFNFRVNNVLNHEYESNAWVYRYYYGGAYYQDSGFFPQAGRHYLVGVTMRFE